MDELKHRAGEKLEALHVAAKTAADNGKSRVHDVVQHTTDAIRKVHQAFSDLWNHELIAEGRERVAAWSSEAVRRIREGAPPLSPVLLYEELLALWHDRVWRRSMLIFACGVFVGGSTGILIGLRISRRVPAGPHARALHSHPDQSVILVEDAVTPGAGTGEVLVRVQAFSVCSVDRAALRGRAHTLRSLIYRGYVTVGRGFAGVVLDVGQGVTDLEMGDEVWGCVSEWSGGAATELLTIRSVALCGAAAGAGAALLQLLGGWGAHVTTAAPRHAAMTLQNLGSSEFVDVEMPPGAGTWGALEDRARRAGPWDAVLVCAAAEVPSTTTPNGNALLKSTASRRALLDLRPGALISDRLPAPFTLIFATSFYGFRVLRWLVGLGSHTDWLEDRYRLREGLDTLTKLVEGGALAPMLDKVYLPQDFESALAHACSEEAIGTTVIRFP